MKTHNTCCIRAAGGEGGQWDKEVETQILPFHTPLYWMKRRRADAKKQNKTNLGQFRILKRIRFKLLKPTCQFYLNLLFWVVMSKQQVPKSIQG